MKNKDYFNKKGIACFDINNKYSGIVDPDNVFWNIFRKTNGETPFISRKALSLYERTKESCDREMDHIRFDTGLTAIYIDPTDLCNADCPYCYVPKKLRKEGRSMSQEELDFTLKKIAAYSKGRRKLVIIFHASEPLLVKDILFNAIEKFNGIFYFGIQTNAVLLEKRDVVFLKKHRVSIGISLDAADMVTNNRSRRCGKAGGNFRKAVAAIDWFKGYKGLNVITTMTKLNIPRLADLVKFLHKKRVPCVLINPVRLTQSNSRGLRPDDKVMAKYFIKAIEEAIKCSRNSSHQIIIGNFANTILSITAPSARRLMCDISPCGGGRCFFTITASGEMIPCGEFIGLKGFSGGNIFRNSIETAMRSKQFKQIRSRFVEKIPECDICILRNICGAPCPAELHSLGNMYKKSVFCEFYKEIMNYAFKLISEGKEKYCFRPEGLNNLEYVYNLNN